METPKKPTVEQLRADSTRLLDELESRREALIGARRDASWLTLHIAILEQLIGRLPKPRRPKTPPPAEMQGAFDWSQA